MSTWPGKSRLLLVVFGLLVLAACSSGNTVSQTADESVDQGEEIAANDDAENSDDDDSESADDAVEPDDESDDDAGETDDDESDDDAVEPDDESADDASGDDAGETDDGDATDEDAAPTETSSSTTTTSTTTTTTTSIPSSQLPGDAPPLDEDGIVRVARTSTGVVLPVVSPFEDGYLVDTPCQNTAVVLDAEVNDRVHVVIDPGHGGSETGAVSPDDQIVEGDINLEVALMVEERLADLGYESILTRYSDIRVPIVTRVEIADRLEADLLISIHHQASNEFPISDTPGVEVFYQQLVPESKRFAGILVEETLESYSPFDINWFTGADAGAVYRLNTDTGIDFYGMIRRPETTAVLAEMGFLGNEEELELLRTGELQVAEAEAITNAIVRWFTTDDSGGGFVEPSFSITAAGPGGGLGGCEDPDLGQTLAFSDDEIESDGESETEDE